MARVCQLFSGSSGNSILISSKGHNLLVDIGVSAKRCEDALKAIDVSPDSIEAVFVSHEHTDHSKGLRVFSKKHSVPVFASEACIEKMYSEKLIDYTTDIRKFDYHTNISGVEIMGFKQSHDSVDCLGYRFNFDSGRSVGICTDTGFVTQNAKQVLRGVDMIFIESNHETTMLQMGPYPYPLKQRILSERGHLSNFACSEFIKELAESGTTRFVLCHLSRENNLPEIARQTAVSALSELGLLENQDYRLYVSPEENAGRGITI